MRIIKFSFTNGYAGGNEENCEIYPSSTSNATVNMFCDMMRAELSEDYAYLSHGYPWEVEEGGYFETEEEAIEAQEDYYAYCECSWDEITLDELKEWCAGHYNEYEDRYAKTVEEMLIKGE